MASAAPQNSRWLYGPLPDLLLGCGGAYALLVGLLAFVGPTLGSGQVAILVPLVALLVGAPHYGATLMRVYEHRQDRRRYALFSLWATIAIAALFVAGVWNPAVGVFMITLYLSWSPWHYTGQNYGIAVLFLRRNGVEISPTDKRWFYASFLLSFALVLIVMHSPGGDPGDSYAQKVLRFQPIGLPVELTSILVPLLAGAAGTALIVASTRLLRRASARALLPAGLLLLTQLLWFSLPFLLRYWNVRLPGMAALSWDFRTYYFVWIAAGHQIQYLWVTSYYARQTGGWRGYSPWYAKALAAGSGLWMLPALVFGPIGLGALSMDQGLAILIASAVNIHHFVLDGAIWKLRGPLAKILIRNEGEIAPADAGSGVPALRRFVWAACAVGLFLFVFQSANQLAIVQSDRRGDLDGSRTAWQRLGWFGLDEAEGRLVVARRLLRNGDFAAARQEFERTLALAPLAAAWHGLAETYAREGDWQRAAESCQRGLELAPDHLPLLGHGALAWRHAGRPERALPLIERAIALDPDNEHLRSEHGLILAAAQ